MKLVFDGSVVKAAREFLSKRLLNGFSVEFIPTTYFGGSIVPVWVGGFIHYLPYEVTGSKIRTHPAVYFIDFLHQTNSHLFNNIDYNDTLYLIDRCVDLANLVMAENGNGNWDGEPAE